jgi:predicted metal-dependent enzyme (double-stranded beta helix superfamily)
MKNRDFLLAEDGELKPCPQVSEWKLLKESYRFYRFLTEVEDIFENALEKGIEEISYLPEIRRLVGQLTLNSYWMLPSRPRTLL